MRPALAAVVALVLVSPLAGCGGSRAATTTDSLAGVWEGEGRQWNDGGRSREPDEEWTIRVTLAPGATGAYDGSVDYPSLQCGGRLEYVGPNTSLDAQPGDMIFRETITYGTDRCVTGGTVMLRPSTRRGIVLAWAIADRPTVASARLERQ